MSTALRTALAGLALFGAGILLAIAMQRLTARPPVWPGGVASPAPQARPARVIATSPSITECVFALGAGPSLVGVDEWSKYPPETIAIERIGGLFSPNLERILALHPDYVLIQGQHEKLEAFCRQHGIPCARLEFDDLASLYRNLRELGRILGRSEAAEALCQQMAAGLAAVRAEAAARPPVRAFMCSGLPSGTISQLLTMSDKSFLSDLLRVAGGTNVFGDEPVAYPTISKEALLERAPEVIVEFHPGETFDAAGLAVLQQAWQTLPGLPAVRNGRICILTEDYLLVPGPRVVLTARRLLEALRPPPRPTPASHEAPKK